MSSSSWNGLVVAGGGNGGGEVNGLVVFVFCFVLLI